MLTDKIYARAKNRTQAQEAETAYIDYKLEVMRVKFSEEDKADRNPASETAFAIIPFPVVR